MKHLLLTTITTMLLVGCAEAEIDRTLIAAIARGDIKEVKQHLATGADVNAKNKVGGTHLHFAALEGRKEIVELLIAKGADVNAKDGTGRSPLDSADDSVAEILRKNGAR